MKRLAPRPPIDKAEMNKKRWEGHHSLCQTLRDVYHMTNNEELKLQCRIAYAMSKAIHERLKWYKAKEENGIINLNTGPQ